MTMADNHVVDCYDTRYWLPEIHVETEQASWEFVFAPERKHGREFAAQVCVDEMSLLPRLRCRYPRHRRFALLKESPLLALYGHQRELAEAFPVVGTFSRGLLAAGPPFVPLYYGTNFVSGGIPRGSARKTRLASIVASIEHPDSGGYTLRKEVCALLVDDRRVDRFGKGVAWVDDKRDALTPYAFSVAMENTRHDYYFTEKLIDCFLTYTVPIYWGCPSIADFFDVRGMLVFTDATELTGILDRLSFELYEAMLPFVLENRKRAEDNAWVDNEGLYQRFARRVEPYLRGAGPVPSWRRSRAFAAGRLLWERRSPW